MGLQQMMKAKVNPLRFVGVMLFVWGLCLPAGAAPGDLDATFSSDGYDIQDVGAGEDDALYAVTVDSSDRVVVAGYVNNGIGASPDYDFLVMRFDTDGTLDSSFGTGGVVTTDVSGLNYNDQAYAVVIDAGGRILVGGTASTGSEDSFAVVRYNANGTLDTGFGTGGIFTDMLSSGTGAVNSIRALAIHQNGTSLDGQITAVGYTGLSMGMNDFAVLRLNTDGSLDTSFNSPQGWVRTDLFSFNFDDRAYAGVIDTSDRLVVAGSHDAEGDLNFALARYTSAGTLDTAFDSNGYQTYDLGGNYNEEAYGVAVQADGRIVAAGYANDGSQDDVAVLRVLADGSYDTNFNSPDGYVVTDIFSAATNDRGQGLVLDADGRILVGGWHLESGYSDFAILRYLSDGTLDPDFDGGAVTTDFAGVDDNSANALALDGDGRAILAGSAVAASLETAVARYETTTTSPDPGNSPPDTPGYVGPAPFTVFAPGDPVTLEAGPFSDPDGDSHVSTRWRIARADQEFFVDNPGSPFDWEVTSGDLTRYTVPNPETNFIPGMAYMWIVGYQDSGSGEYTWSEDWMDGPYYYGNEENVFVVGAQETDTGSPVSPGTTAAAYRMLSCNHIPDDPGAAAIIGDDLVGGYDTTQYKIGVYDPDYNGGSYREYPDFKVYPGGAVWMLARDGLQIDITGVPVTVTADVECPLHYSVQNADGWNMVGPPNREDYRWSEVEVLVYDPNNGSVIFSDRIGDLPADNPYIDTRLWEWENGQYSSNTALMESGKGYWVRAKQDHVNLGFRVSAQATWSNPNVMLALGLERAKHLVGVLYTQREAIADNNDSPPAPMSSFHATYKDEKSSVDVSCFITSLLE